MSDKLILGIVAILAVTLFGMASVCMVTGDVECASGQSADNLTEGWMHQSECDTRIATAVSVNATAIEATNEAIDEDRRIPDNLATAYAFYYDLELFYEEALDLAEIWIEDLTDALSATPTPEPELPAIPHETTEPTNA